MGLSKGDRLEKYVTYVCFAFGQKCVKSTAESFLVYLCW